MNDLFVVRNNDLEYLQVDFDSKNLAESWVEYPEASWLSEDDLEFVRAEYLGYEILSVVQITLIGLGLGLTFKPESDYNRV